MISKKEIKRVCREILDEIKHQYDIPEKRENVYQHFLKTEEALDEYEKIRKHFATNIFNAQKLRKEKCYKFMSFDLIENLDDEDLFEMFFHYFPEHRELKINFKLPI